MGRSRKNAVQVYLNDEELAFLEQRVKEMGYKTKSEFLRKAALQCAVFVVDTNAIFNEVKKLSSELRRIGVNINQIARRVNETNEIFAADIQELKEGQIQIWHMLEQKLLNIPSEV